MLLKKDVSHEREKWPACRKSDRAKNTHKNVFQTAIEIVGEKAYILKNEKLPNFCIRVSLLVYVF